MLRPSLFAHFTSKQRTLDIGHWTLDICEIVHVVVNYSVKLPAEEKAKLMGCAFSYLLLLSIAVARWPWLTEELPDSPLLLLATAFLPTFLSRCEFLRSMGSWGLRNSHWCIKWLH